MNKFIALLIVFVLYGYCLYSCKKMDDTYRQFVVPDGITYIGKVDSVRVFSGRKRIKITWLRGADPKAKKATIYWNDKTDSLNVPINTSNPKDTVSAIIQDLKEGTYTFQIYTFDNEGHSSIAVEALGVSYDTLYENALLVRPLKGINQNATGDTTILTWYPSDTNSLWTELHYKNLDMEDKVAYLPKDSSQIQLTDYLAGTTIYFRSLFTPDKASLDTFYTKFDSTRLEANLLQDFNAWQQLKIANNDNVLFHLQPEKKIVISSTAAGGHQGVYQPIQVEANAKYRIDMHVAGSGATDTWFEVYVGTAVPVQGSDYTSGGNRMGLNTWSGCGKTVFDSQLADIACSGSRSLVSFPDSGTVYFVIKCGGASLGTTGITVSNITMRKVAD